MKKILLLLLIMLIWISFGNSTIWNSSWSYKANCTINSTVSSTLTNYPAVCILNTSALISSGLMRSDCGDLRSINSSESGELLYEIANNTCNTSATEIYTLIPSLPSAGSIIWLYFGNPSATTTQNPTALWAAAEAKCVYHLSDTADSAGFMNVGTVIGSPTKVGGYWGIANTAYNFSAATGDALQGTGFCMGNTGSNSQPLTVFIRLLSQPNSNVMATILHERKNSSSSTYIGDYSIVERVGAASNNGAFFWRGSATNGDGYMANTTILLPKSVWESIAVMYDGVATNHMNDYINGDNRTSVIAAAGYTGLSGGVITIGKDPAGGSAGYKYNGTVDEIRIYNNSKSNDWILAEWAQTYIMGNAMNASTNIPPILSNISISPTLLYQDRNVTCSINYTDDENSTFIVYAGLAINGTIDGSYNVTNSAYANSSVWTFQKNITGQSIGTNISCWSYATDGLLNSTVNYSSNVSILPFPPPTLQALTLLPATIYIGNNLTCSINYSDADDNIFTVRAGFAINGTINNAYNQTNSSYQNSTAWNIQFNTAGFQKGTNVSCWANANDSHTTTATSFTANVTLQNRCEVSVVLVSPANGSSSYSTSQTLKADVSMTNCSNATTFIYFNGVNSNNQTVTTNATINFTVTPAAGNHSWYAFSYAENNVSINSTSANWTFEKLTTTPDLNRWYPTSLSVYNVRLSKNYPKNGYTYTCKADIFAINDSDILTASFEIYGAGVNISSAQSQSIGTQDPNEHITYQSGNFTLNGTGVMNCSVAVVDEFGNSANAIQFFYVSTALGTCADNDTCTITAEVNATGLAHHYYSFNITTSGSIQNNAGVGITLYSDANTTMNGLITLGGGSTYANGGTLNFYTNDAFVQGGNISSYGASGATDYSGKTGGNINIYANEWIQSGFVTNQGGTAGACTGSGGDGRAGGGYGSITFNGGTWRSTGAISLVSGNSSAGCANSGGTGGTGGDQATGGDGISVFGNFTKTAGTIVWDVGKSGNGGSATNAGNNGGAGGGGSGGGQYFLKNINGSLYFNGFTITFSNPSGGIGGVCTGAGCTGGNGGDYDKTGLIFISADTTYFYWNVTTMLTGGAGGAGNTGTAANGNGGDGAGWDSTALREFIQCHDTCVITANITLTGGAGGAGTIAGTAGTSGAWEANYNKVGTGNDFTKLLPARTTYNLSATAGFPRNSVVNDTISIYIYKQGIYALEMVNISWNVTNLENLTHYFQIKEIDTTTGKTRFLWQNATSLPTAQRQISTQSKILDTNRMNASNYIYYVRIYSDYYRYSPWFNITALVVGLANNSMAVSTTGVDYLGSISFTCNYTGYDFAWNGSQYYEDTSTIRPVYYGDVHVIVANNGTNSTYNASWDATTDTYIATSTSNYLQGNHSWWCIGSKPNWKGITTAGTPFNVGNFQVRLPSGITSVDLICIFPTVTGMKPIGQTTSTPIFTIVNNNDSNKNYSMRLSYQPTNASIYFTNISSRANQHLLNATANITVCENVTYGSTTACRLWLYADCNNSPVISAQNLSYIVGEQS